MKEGIAEALMRIAKMDSRQEKINALRKDHSKPMEIMINSFFNPRVRFVLPEGDPPYKPQPKEMDLQHVLMNQIRKLTIFVEGGQYPNLTNFKRETLFVEFLENLDPDDAKLMLAVKDKKFPYKGIDKDIFYDAWPNLAKTWGPRGEVQPEPEPVVEETPVEQVAKEPEFVVPRVTRATPEVIEQFRDSYIAMGRPPKTEFAKTNNIRYKTMCKYLKGL